MSYLKNTSYPKLKYRGFTGTVEYDTVYDCYCGVTTQGREKIKYRGTSFTDFKTKFKDRVDDYLQYKEKMKRSCVNHNLPGCICDILLGVINVRR